MSSDETTQPQQEEMNDLPSTNTPAPESSAADTPEQSWEIPPEWGVRALVVWNMSTRILSAVGSFFWKLGKGIYKSFQAESYVFFKDSSYPYNKNDLLLDAPGVPPVAWYYDSSQQIFVAGHLHDTSEHVRVHHLPFLSAEIKYNELLLHDITEFMEKIRWAGDANQEAPSAEILMAVWSLSTGIVLQKSDLLKLVVIDEEGNEKSIDLRS